MTTPCVKTGAESFHVGRIYQSSLHADKWALVSVAVSIKDVLDLLKSHTFSPRILLIL
jgi:hypothetical protein